MAGTIDATSTQSARSGAFALLICGKVGGMCSNGALGLSTRAQELIKEFRLEIEESVAIRSFFLAARNVSEASRTSSAPLHNLICKALLQRQVMLLMRLYDKEGSDRACLAEFFRLLGIPGVSQSITTDDGEPMMREAIDLWRRLKSDPRKASLRKIRDAVAAHNLLDQRSKLDQITYDQVWEFSNMTEKLVENLAAGSGIARVRLDAAEKIWGERADEYWRRVTQT